MKKVRHSSTILGLILISILTLTASSCQDIDVIAFKVVKSAAVAVDTGMKIYAENYCPEDCPNPVSLETHEKLRKAYTSYQAYASAVVLVAKTYTQLKEENASKFVLEEKEKEVIKQLELFSNNYEDLRKILDKTGVKNVTPFEKLEK